MDTSIHDWRKSQRDYLLYSESGRRFIYCPNCRRRRKMPTLITTVITSGKPETYFLCLCLKCGQYYEAHLIAPMLKAGHSHVRYDLTET